MTEKDEEGNWVKSIFAGVIGAAAILFFLMMLVSGGRPSSSDPKKEQWKNSYNACIAEANHPSKTQYDKDVILKGMCQGLRERYLRDYHEEP